MTLSIIHGRLGNAALLYFLFVAVWGFWRAARRQTPDASYWGALAVGEIFLLLLSGLGAYLWLTGLRPMRSIHLLYGVTSLLTIPAAYAYTRDREGVPEGLVYAITTLITFGLIMRAMTTAG